MTCGLRLKSKSLPITIVAAAVSLSLAATSVAQDDATRLVFDRSNSETPEQVVVSATKLPEPPRSVAGSVSSLSGAQLEALGVQSASDYLTRVPGVVFNAGLPGLSTAIFRGISTTTSLDQGQGTTGYFLNEVPLTDPNFAVAIPDIDVFDVEDIAVMQGPQATLFGSAALGGAVNYQAAVPDLTSFHTHLQGAFAGTAHGANSDSGKGMINLPLMTDTLAVRAVFIYRSDGGYIDNVGTTNNATGGTVTRGGRTEALWSPVEGTKVGYLYLKQIQDTADNPYQEPALAGSLRKMTLFPERYVFSTTINNLRLDQNLTFATLVATATYHQKTRNSASDFTSGFGPLFGNQLSPIRATDASLSNGTTFEVRLASRKDQRVTYLIGAMRDLTHESFLDLIRAPGAQQYTTTTYDPVFGPGFGTAAAPNDLLATSILSAEGDERAVFGESTYHFDSRWALTLGGRLYDTRIIGKSSNSGLLEYLATTPNVFSFSYSSAERSRGFTPKASVSWNVTTDMMVYVLADKGFRFGGPNVTPPSATDTFPRTYAPDSLWNYEAGARTNWFDRRLQVDATAFYIDWSNIQVRLGTADGLAYATNLGRAVSYGLEDSVAWHPDVRFSFESSLSYLNATLNKPFHSGANVELAGATLPGASKWSLSGGITYRVPGALQPVIHLTEHFISSAPAGFGFVAPVPQGNFIVLDSRISSYFKDVEATILFNNITNRRGVTNANYYPGSPIEQYIIRPRTVGMTFDYRY
jgi:outer membrane receptor protein involved in Fe transport